MTQIDQATALEILDKMGDPDQSDELKAAIENASIDLSAETAEIAPEHRMPAVGGVIASAPVTPSAPLFDEPTFDAEKAWHDVMRKSETVRSARDAYELAKEEASDKKKVLEARQKELEDLIKELTWKEQRADQAKREPRLVAAPDTFEKEYAADFVEAPDGVEGMGELPTEDELDARFTEELDKELAKDQGDEGDVGSLADA